MKNKLGWISLPILLLLTNLTLAQTSDEPWSPSIFEDASFQFVSFANLFHEDHSAVSDEERASLDTRIVIENLYDLSDRWSLDIKMSLSQTVPKVRTGALPSPTDQDPDSPWIDAERFYFSFYTENAEMGLGKAVTEIGYAELYSPVNRFSSADYTNPQWPFPRGDYQIQASWFRGDDQLKFTYFPYQFNSFDPADERWLTASGDSDFFIDIGVPGIDTENQDGMLLTYSGTRESFDFFIGGHYGPGGFAVIQPQASGQTIKRTPTATSILAGFVSTAGSWSYFGDAIYQDTLNRDDDNFLRYAVGFSYRESKIANLINIQEIRPTVTYSGDYVLDEADPMQTIYSSELARVQQDNVLFNLDLILNNEVTIYFGGSYNLSEEDSMQMLGLEYDLTDSVRLRIRSMAFTGDQGTQFGRFVENNFTSIGINYRF